MGNQHGHGSKSGTATPNSINSSHDGSRKSITRSSSGADIQDKPSQMLPVEKLAKILLEKSQKLEGVNGITKDVFTRSLFPRYQVLGEKLFCHFLKNANSKNKHISLNSFKQQCELYLSVMDDDKVRDTLVKMWSTPNNDNDNGVDTVTPDDMTSLLMCTYHISMDHYAEGPQMCLSCNKTLKAVVDSCFHSKKQLSLSYVSHWIETNIPRLLFPLHRYAVHALATSWRILEESDPNLASEQKNDKSVVKVSMLYLYWSMRYRTDTSIMGYTAQRVEGYWIRGAQDRVHWMIISSIGLNTLLEDYEMMEPFQRIKNFP